MSGYVRIHRSLLGHPAFRNESETMAFAWLIMKASWRAARVRYKGHIISLERGQVAISVRDFAAAHDRNKNWISRLLKSLICEDMIKTDAGTGVLVITICNYDEYQSDAADAGTAAGTPNGTRRGTGAGQERDTEQRREEGKKEEVSSVAKATSPRIWVLPAGVSSQVWTDFLANRKRKRLGNTATAWKQFQDDLARVASQTGIPPPELIERCTAKGWGAIYDPRTEQDDRRTNSLGRDQSADGLSSTARAALHVFGR